MRREYDKLVRDRIPEIVRADDEEPITHTADEEEYERRLREKLLEEAEEFAADGDRAELADVLAVVRAIRDHRGLTAEELARTCDEKAAERGGFGDRVVLEAVETDPE